jgi:predicted MFS family arabinose efflux permease
MQSSTVREMSSPWGVALSGQLALAVAIGIGRFAFTPILPMMVDDAGLSVAQGGWLASANYLGYFLGALAAMAGGIGQRLAIRVGLVAIAATTLAMGFASSVGAWLALRALPGFASAWVLVNVSAWSLDRLGKAGRGDLAGVVYAGVGVGIVFAGLACMALGQARLGSVDAWLALGLSAIVATGILWPIAGGDSPGAVGAAVVRASSRDIPEFWRLVFCQGAFGFGYIIPATFLPVMAKEIVADPLSFGWAWPAFGAAAAASTFVAARLAAVLSNRAIWIGANLAMAAGVLVPLAVPGLTAIAIAALLVGGTFMVTTMVGFQEARRVAGPRARLLIAAMTAAFAAGQIAGPLLVSVLSATNEFSASLVAAAIPLFIAAYLLNDTKSERP